MSLKAMYNQISGHYATADKFGSLSLSHHEAIAQIKKHTWVNALTTKFWTLESETVLFLSN